MDGAWAEECRIHYYNSEQTTSLDRAKSAGRGDNITYRINSNEYINHILQEYSFCVEDGGYSADIYPPDSPTKVWKRLEQILILNGESTSVIKEHFMRGWNL